MTTIILKNPEIPVHLPEGLSEEKLLAFEHFTNWIKTLTRSLAQQHRATNPPHPFHEDPYSLRSITIQSYDLWAVPGKPSPRLGFLKLLADVRNAAGETLPGSVFFRGPSVAVLFIVVPDDVEKEEEERYVLLTVQSRVPAGSLEFVELPAGMVDEDGSFVGTAAREIEEELGVEVKVEELVSLSAMADAAATGATTTTAASAAGPNSIGDGDNNSTGNSDGIEGEDEGEGEIIPVGVFPSVGGCDEFIPIFMHERRVPRTKLDEWEGKCTGLREEGERIKLKLVKMKDLWKEGARDGKCLSALALWEGLRREGRL